MKNKPNHELVKSFFVNMGLPAPETEYKFHTDRKWRMDYAWPDVKVALEVEGGVWSGGRHTSARGFLADMEKYNSAAALGWKVLRTTPGELLRLATAKMIMEARCA